MRLLLALGLFVSSLLACPPLVEKFCKCEELHNGVKLDCSHTKGYEVVQILRQNQAMLGLVQELKMQKAEISKISPSFFAGLYIKQLDLSFNELKEIDDNAFQGMSPVLQEISLHHNNLTKIPVTALAGINTLLRLDLSNNSIGDLGETDAFPNLPKLYDINLASNKICSVHSSIFQKIKNTIQTISFGSNCLKSVPSSAIRGLTQLQALHLLKNNISQLEALSFLNLPVLNLLNLAGNSITEINRQAFLNVPNLRYLYLTDNVITKIASGQFVTFERLEMLDLTRNKIEKLQTGSFSQLPALTRLYLGNNRINVIEKGAFTNSSIVILVLSNNQLQVLPEGILDGLSALQQVSFQRNQIKEIDQNAFYNAPSIALVDLSYNQILDLPPSTFLAQMNLFMIDLSSNKMARTPYAAFNRRVGTVMLKENPLVCIEKVHLIQDGVGTYLPSEEDIVCGGKPTTTTTTKKPAQIMISHNRQHSTGERVVKPSGAFQQANLSPLITEPEEASSEGQPDLLPSRPERPAILNARPRTRVRGPVGSDIAHTESVPEIEMESGVLATEDQSGPINPEETGTEVEDVSEPVQEEDIPLQAEPISSTFPPLKSTTLGARVYTDIADNPNRILPFPVPFLKRPNQIHQAQRIQFTPSAKPPTSQEQHHTLPPSIVIDPPMRVPALTTSSEIPDNNVWESEHLEQIAPPVEQPEKKQPRVKVSESRFSTGIIIIIICITAAVVCMLIVFIALCCLRCRNGSRFTSSYSDSSVARTNAYVQSQAQMNMIYGTLGRERCVPLAAQDEGHPWVYNPGPNYCNYYK